MGKIAKFALYLILDVLSVLASWILAMVLTKCDFALAIEQDGGLWFLIGSVLFACLVNSVFGLNNKLLKYFDITDTPRVFLAGVSQIVFFTITAFINTELGITWLVVSSIVYMGFLVFGRYAYKIYGLMSSLAKQGALRRKGIRVMIIGAGSAGAAIIHEMKVSDKINYYPVCVLDDDKYKIGQSIHGVRIVGDITEAEYFAKKYDIQEIVIAIPSAGKKAQKRAIEYCQNSGCVVKIIPGVYQFINGSVSVSSIKNVEISDLLGREQIKVNLVEIGEYISNKVVMVTGGGGSIGSELCRQITIRKPKKLIIVDIYENNAYYIQQELKRKYPDLDLETIIASVRNKKRIDDIFEKYKPEIVFHAAAHKHVPLMEDSPNEAIKNNVGGTFNVADCAGKWGVKKFVLISTDKAVNPTNIMGASKRICEMIVQTMNKKYDTDYVAVRFGNVLGSNGSVIPLFREQIAAGGPITVTHKDIVRYFMTIPEAVSLVLQAGAYATGGEIFVLDMGEPVRIYDLAVNMIKLSGLTPFKDIDIKITGLRPGEKLYEERLMDEEGLLQTENKMISIGKPIEFDQEGFFDKIANLCDEAYNETDNIREQVSKIVPTYVVKK